MVTLPPSLPLSCRAKHNLGSLNSVNIVRLLIQIFHYFYAYLQLIPSEEDEEGREGGVNTPSKGKEGGREKEAEFASTGGKEGGSGSASLPLLSFVVPTGAAGHITAGLLAAMMGLPVRCLLMATNRNGTVMNRMVREGVWGKEGGREGGAEGKEGGEEEGEGGKEGGREEGGVIQTNSPAMDIQSAYNVERILSVLAREGGREGGKEDAPLLTGKEIGQMMDRFYEGGSTPLPPSLLQHLESWGVACALPVKEEEVEATIHSVYEGGREGGREGGGYILDPHTAVGVTVAAGRRREGGKEGWREGERVVCMGCAHPAKFAKTIQSALKLTSEEEAVEVIKREGGREGGGGPLFLGVGEEVRKVEEGRRGEGGREGGVGCPVFGAGERGRWREMLEEEVVLLEREEEEKEEGEEGGDGGKEV